MLLKRILQLSPFSVLGLQSVLADQLCSMAHTALWRSWTGISPQKTNLSSLYRSVGTPGCELGHGHMATGVLWNRLCAHANIRHLSSCDNQKWFLCFMKGARTAFIIMHPSARLWAWNCPSSCPAISQASAITWTMTELPTASWFAAER